MTFFSEKHYTDKDGWNNYVAFCGDFDYATDVLAFVKEQNDGRCWYVTGYRQTGADEYLVFFKADDPETSKQYAMTIAVLPPEHPSDPECPPRLSVRDMGAAPS